MLNNNTPSGNHPMLSNNNTLFRYKIHCVTENQDKFWYLQGSSHSPTTCPTDSTHQVDLASIEVTDIGSQSQSVQSLSANPLSISPYGVFFPATANQATIYDFPLPSNTTFHGVVLFASNSSLGDNFSISIIDKANVVNLGGTEQLPVVVNNYIQKWYVIPGFPNTITDASVSQNFPQGLFARITYNSVSLSQDVVVIANFTAYNVLPAPPQDLLNQANQQILQLLR